MSISAMRQELQAAPLGLPSSSRRTWQMAAPSNAASRSPSTITPLYQMAYDRVTAALHKSEWPSALCDLPALVLSLALMAVAGVAETPMEAKLPSPVETKPTAVAVNPSPVEKAATWAAIS